jgi:hypothetical protein
MDWIQLAQDRGQCLTYMNMVMNLWYKGRKFLDHLSNYQLFKEDPIPCS